MKLREIPLDYLRQVLSYNAASGALTWLRRPREHFSSDRHWNMWNVKHAGRTVNARSTDGSYRITIKFMGATYSSCLVHRFAWALATGAWPTSEIDHIDGNPGNNCLSNLREAIHIENAQNQKLRNTNTSGFMGVTWDAQRKKWVAKIQSNGRHHNLGRFDDPKDAFAAYTIAKATFHSFSPVPRLE